MTITKTRPRARQARYNLDGLPIEIFATDQEGEAYVVTEPGEHPVGYLFRRINGEMACVSVEDDVTPQDLARMELLSPGKHPTHGTDLGDALWSMALGLIGTLKMCGRSLNGRYDDGPKLKRSRSRSKAIRY